MKLTQQFDTKDAQTFETPNLQSDPKFRDARNCIILNLSILFRINRLRGHQLGHVWYHTTCEGGHYKRTSFVVIAMLFSYLKI